MLLYTLFTRRSFSTASLRQYRLLLFFNLISSVTDLLSAYTICNAAAVPLWLNYAISIVFFITHNCTGVLFFMYVLAVVRGNAGNRVERLAWISTLSLIVLFTLTTPLTHGIFYFDADLVYQHGPLLPVLYVLMALTLTYTIVLIIKYRSDMSSFQMGTNFAFIFLIFASIVFQAFFPDCLLENFIIATACVMMNAALDNPATYFYQSTSCFNQSSFNLTVSSLLASASEFSLMAFAFDDISVFRKRYTEKDYDQLIRATIHHCQKLCGHRRVFILQDASFVILQDRGDVSRLIQGIEAAVTQPFRLESGEEVSVTPHFCILDFPGEAKTVNEVNLVIQDMLTVIYRKTGAHVIRDSSRLITILRREDDVTHAVRGAVRNHGITVLFQPILDVKTGNFLCAEALVRLRDNPLDIYPDEFIPIAEKNGLILDIGVSVLEQVCRFLQESRCEEYGLEKINVNLSMLQLTDRAEVDRLIDICRRFRVPPERIVFEVTETAAESDGGGSLAENIAYLKDSGFSLSLDDYGSGYSNLSTLIRIPFDQIKLDKNLLWSAMEGGDSMAVLESMVRLVQLLRKSCLVEGVEDEAMESLLNRLGVDYYQGYRYSRPISADSLLSFLAEHNH